MKRVVRQLLFVLTAAHPLVAIDYEMSCADFSNQDPLAEALIDSGNDSGTRVHEMVTSTRLEGIRAN